MDAPPLARRRFDANAWLSALGDRPDDVAQQLELLGLDGLDDAAQTLLAGVSVQHPPHHPTAARGTSLRWMLPRSIPRRRASAALEARVSTHMAAALGLAARSDVPEALRVRELRSLHLPQMAPWWLHDSLERFDRLVSVRAYAPWHTRATVPARLLCMPSVTELILHAAGLGDRALADATWNLPSITVLALSGNALTRLPVAVLGLTTLEQLFLSDNPIRTLPEGLTDLPRLRVLDVQRTEITALPRRLLERDGLFVHLPRP